MPDWLDSIGDIGKKMFGWQTKIGDSIANAFEGVSKLPDALAQLLSNNTFLYLALAVGGLVVFSMVMK